MAWDLTSVLVGAVAGFVVGAIIFTSTGKELTGLAGEHARAYRHTVRRSYTSNHKNHNSH